jgi:hypothetical protein
LKRHADETLENATLGLTAEEVAVLAFLSGSVPRRA